MRSLSLDSFWPPSPHCHAYEYEFSFLFCLVTDSLILPMPVTSFMYNPTAEFCSLVLNRSVTDLIDVADVLVLVARPVRRHEAERDGGQEAGGGATEDVGGGDRRLPSQKSPIWSRKDEFRTPYSNSWKTWKKEINFIIIDSNRRKEVDQTLRQEMHWIIDSRFSKLSLRSSWAFSKSTKSIVHSNRFVFYTIVWIWGITVQYFTWQKSYGRFFSACFEEPCQKMCRQTFAKKNTKVYLYTNTKNILLLI